MDSAIAIIVRLSARAHENVPQQTYCLLANNMSIFLHRIENDHGIDTVMYVLYAAALVLGHSVGPLSYAMTKKLVDKGCIVTRITHTV